MKITKLKRLHPKPNKMPLKNYLLLACLCFACAFQTIAQSKKDTKHEKFGLTWQLPNTWALAPEKNTDTEFYAYPTSGGQAKMKLVALPANSDAEAAQGTVTFMQNNSIEPAFLKDLTPRKVKQGKLQMQIFEKDGLDMKLDNGTEIYKSEKLVLINTDKGKKFILHLAEYYQKPAKQQAAIENALKTLKVK